MREVNVEYGGFTRDEVGGAVMKDGVVEADLPRAAGLEAC